MNTRWPLIIRHSPGRRNTKDTIYQGVACLRSWKILMMAIGERGEATERVRAWESLCKASTCSARVYIFRNQELHPKPPEEEGFIPLVDHLRGLNNNTDAQVPLRASQVVLVVKNPPAKAGDLRDAGSIPGLGRSPREGNGYPLQYSSLVNSMDRGAWRDTVHGITKSRTRLSN